MGLLCPGNGTDALYSPWIGYEPILLVLNYNGSLMLVLGLGMRQVIEIQFHCLLGHSVLLCRLFMKSVLGWKCYMLRTILVTMIS